jgi:hypothetical protein
LFGDAATFRPLPGPAMIASPAICDLYKKRRKPLTWTVLGA